MKESRKRKFDAKGDEGIFLGYSYKSKTYRCLNLSTHKIIESAHVKFDEFAKMTEEESKKEPEDFKRFFFIDTVPETSFNKKTTSTKPSTIIKLQEVQTKSQGPESHSKTTEPMPTESKQQKPKVEVQEDENAIHSRGKEPVLAKYFKRHHAPD